MFWNKKEDEAKLPDLPSPRSPFNVKSNITPPRENLIEERSSLPAFPEFPEQEEHSQAAAKKVFSENRPEQLGGPLGRDIKVVEMEEWEPVNMQEGELPPESPEHPELEEIAKEEEPERRYVVEPPPRARRIVQVRETAPADVFVRIDKFHSARKSLNEIRNQLEDIDELVKKIRETKLREEQELSNWEKDIAHIKTRLQTVTEDIFEKVE